MTMKTILITFFMALGVFVHCRAQVPDPVNQTIIRLTVIKDGDKVLMRKTPYRWMTPAVYFKERQSIQEVLDEMTENYGIQISGIGLRGLFTYTYDFKPTADMRQLYVANYVSGNLVSPSENEEVYWMPIEEALDKLDATVPSLKQMTKHILDNPDKVWGGSFTLFKANGKMNSRVTEDFYMLANM